MEENIKALGESIGVVTVPEDAVEPLRADEVLSVRPMVVAGRDHRPRLARGTDESAECTAALMEH